MSFNLVELIGFVGFVYSVIAHEVAHGYVALKCGDPTARDAGRLTAHPVPHIDPIRTILMPLLLRLSTGIYFGGAKPVPVNHRKLRVYPRDWIAVSLAGIGTNFLIALGCGAIWQVLAIFGPRGTDSLLGRVLEDIGATNLWLFVFNLIPIPPLDGSRPVRFLLKGNLQRDYDNIEPFGLFVVFVFLQLPGVDRFLHVISGFFEQALFTPIFPAR